MKSTPAAALGGAPFREFLQSELVRRCQQNPSYSMRAFARMLQTDPSTLAKILSGKRVLKKRAIQKLGIRLGLTPFALARFTTTTQTPSGPEYAVLSADAFHVISEWYHYALLELLRVDHFKPDARWAGRALGISKLEVCAALERLQRVGMLKIDEHGNWIDLSGGRSTTVGNDFTAAAFRNLQRQVLQKALVALEEVPMERRDQTSMTFAADSSQMIEAKARIKEFRRDLAAFLSRGARRDQVYHLGISLYPVIRFENRGPVAT